MAVTGWTMIPLNKLMFAAWNYKTDDEFKEQQLLNNIEKNGQIENLIVREGPKGMLEVVNGNHRLAVMQKLGFTECMVFSLGKVSEAHAKRVAVETNETKFASDHMKLSKTMAELMHSFGEAELQKTMPFTVPELKSFVEMSKFDFDKFKDAAGKVTVTGHNADWTTVSVRVPKDLAARLQAMIEAFTTEEAGDTIEGVKALVETLERARYQEA